MAKKSEEGLEGADEKFERKRNERNRRALARKIQKRADERAKVTIEQHETKSELAARLKRETTSRIREAVKIENRKAKLLAEKEMTARTVLGEPENRGTSRYKRMSMAVLERVAQLGFDPLEQSVKIARGQSLKEDHPFLSKFQSIMDEWCETLESFEELDALEVDKFRAEGIKALAGSFTPIEMRSRHTLELLNYIYPKRKAMEMTIDTGRPDMTVTELQEHEVDTFMDKFEERY